MWAYFLHMNTIEELESEVKQCEACPLRAFATQVVVSSGNPNSGLMVVGEAPGQQEDEQGIPFVGRSGQLLRRALSALGYTEDNMYITNIVKCRPPNNSDPSVSHLSACSGWLKQQIELIRPKKILTVGRISSFFILKDLYNIDLSGLKFGEVIGMKFDIFYRNNVTVVVPNWHPAYLLRNPEKKQEFWDILKTHIGNENNKS